MRIRTGRAPAAIAAFAVLIAAAFVPAGAEPAPGAAGSEEARVQATRPSDTEILLTRTFAAPREAVFAALTQPDLLKRWMHSNQMTLETCEVDLRVGGKLRYVYRRSSGRTIEVRGVFTAVEPPRRFAHEESYDFSPLVLNAETMLDESDGATMLTQRLRYSSREDRDADDEPVVTSAEDAFARLEKHLAQRS